MSEDREYSPKRFAIASVVCPSCHAKLDREAKWCGTCGFTGANCLEKFGDSPPPLLPLLDVANLWNEKETKRVEAAVARFGKRFPQFRLKICAVALGPEINLSLFGFWLMNVCPLLPEETPEDREWTVLFLADADTGRASVTTGYRAEPWLSDEMWGKALVETADPFRQGRPDKAVSMFLDSASKLLDQAWSRSRKQLGPHPHP